MDKNVLKFLNKKLIAGVVIAILTAVGVPVYLSEPVADTAASAIMDSQNPDSE